METKRWRRYGQDRLYVTDEAGESVGWWDLASDKPHPVHEDLLPRLSQAVAGWRAGALNTAGPPRPENRAPSVAGHHHMTDPKPPAPVDLLWNSAGQQLTAHIEVAHAAGQRPTLLRRLLLGKNAYSSWERGAIGERLVAQELRRLVHLDPRWGYLHSIPVGSNGSDIDHLVIGPGGVFALNAKYHQGARIWVGGDTVMVNGVRQPYIRNSRSEAKRVGRLLTQATGFHVAANGLVVPVGAVTSPSSLSQTIFAW